MNIIQQNTENITLNLKKVVEEIKSKLSEAKIKELSKQAEFIKRERKMSAIGFVELCLFLEDNICIKTLTDLCTKLFKEGINISEEGLNKRFNNNAVLFLKSLFLELLNKKTKEDKELILLTKSFKRIRILDSTSFQLPESFSKIYKGSGGSASKAGIKFQLEYDLLSGNIINLETLSNIETDAKYSKVVNPQIKDGDLVLRDLGYFSIDNLKEIEEKKGKYICKYKINTNVWIKKENEFKLLNLCKVVENMPYGTSKELEVFLSNKRLKTRLIICKLPQEKAQLKVMNKQKELKKKGRQLTKKSRILLTANIMITNLSKEEFSIEVIYKLYSLRWQVEIYFKVWKSIFKISEVRKVKIERFKCCFYAKLIEITVSSKLVFKFRNIAFKEKEIEISEYKAFKIIKEYRNEILACILNEDNNFYKLITNIFNFMLKRAKKTKKKYKLTCIEIIGLVA